jgi:hypothetical protein
MIFVYDLRTLFGVLFPFACLESAHPPSPICLLPALQHRPDHTTTSFKKRQANKLNLKNRDSNESKNADIHKHEIEIQK